MDSNFNNGNDPWEFGLDIDDSDLHLTPVMRSSSGTHVEPSPLTPNPVRIIPGPGTIHHKVIGDGGYGKNIIVRAAMILANVSVFTPKPSKHYLNITMRNVVKLFRKDTVPGSDNG
ncbi:retrovirus-related pol polyprotein from transposon TNT 1-94 [Tanacetum coccineum]